MQFWIVPWVVAALAGCAAVFLALKLRELHARAQESAAELASLEDRVRKAEKRATTRSTGDRRREDEVAELRRKLDKAKKRAGQARGEQLTESHRIKELEERLRLRDADVRAARSVGSREVLSPPVRPAPSVSPGPVAPVEVAEPLPKAPEARKAPEASESDAVRAADERATRATAQAESARSELDAARSKLAELEVQRKRQLNKAKTQDKLYASMRLELEAKKDRLGAQQEELERLRALRVALVEPAPVPLGSEDSGQGAEPAS